MGSGILFLEILTDFRKSLFALVLVVVAGLGDGVGLVVAGFADSFTELLVVHLMTVFALHVSAKLLGEFLLQTAHRLDGLMGGFKRTEQVLFGDFVHFALNHHDIFLRCADHDVHVGSFELFEGRIDDVLPVDAGHTALGDRPEERYVRASQSGRCCKSGKGIRDVDAVSRIKGDAHVNLGMIVVGEEGAQGAVNQA